MHRALAMMTTFHSLDWGRVFIPWAYEGQYIVVKIKKGTGGRYLEDKSVLTWYNMFPAFPYLTQKNVV